MSDETPKPVVEEPVEDSTVVREPGAVHEPVPEDVAAEPPAETSAFAPESTSTAAPVYDTSAVSAAEPVAATADPAAAVIAPEAPAAVPQAVPTYYVAQPLPPKKKGNRGVGILFAFVAAIVFTGLFAIVVAAIVSVRTGFLEFDFVSNLGFFTPTLFFFIGFVIVILVANRANWWAYIFGSLFIALVVYFGTVGVGMLVAGALAQTPQEAQRIFAGLLVSPNVIAAALLAREVSIWTGAIVAARGRRVKARNIDARAAFDQEAETRRVEYDNHLNGTRDPAY